MSSVADIFKIQHVVPSVYRKVLRATFGDEWLQWELPTLYDSIEDEFNVQISEDVKNKLAAIRLYDSTDVFYHSARAFESVVLAVNDQDVDPDRLTLCAPEELTYAFLVLSPDTTQFEREIYGYIKACMEQEGVLYYPRGLKFAQPEYKEPLKSLVEGVSLANLPDEIDDTNPTQVQAAKVWRVMTNAVAKLSKMRSGVLELSIE